MLRRYGQFLLGLLAGLLAAGLVLVVARRPSGRAVNLPPLPTAEPLRVYVSGAVVAPGVYRLERGAIWQDALAAAGGPVAGADLGSVNLAHTLADGDEVLIPTLAPAVPPSALPAGDTALPSTSSSGEATEAAPVAPVAPAGTKVNINTATAAELDALPGIGPALAQRIVDYRNTRGPFATLADLTQVSGIGPTTFDQFKDLITVGP